MDNNLNKFNVTNLYEFLKTGINANLFDDTTPVLLLLDDKYIELSRENIYSDMGYACMNISVRNNIEYKDKRIIFIDCRKVIEDGKIDNEYKDYLKYINIEIAKLTNELDKQYPVIMKAFNYMIDKFKHKHNDIVNWYNSQMISIGHISEVGKYVIVNNDKEKV